VAFLKTALRDKYDGLRTLAVSQLDMGNENVKKEMEPILVELVRTDPKRLVKAAAISKLEAYRKTEYAPLFKAALNDSSYTVAANALEALYEVDSVSAKAEAKRLSTQPAKKKLPFTIAYVAFDESSSDSILAQFETMPVSQNKFNMLQSVSDVIENTKSMNTFKRGIDDVVKLRDAIPQNLRNQTDPIINGVLLKGVAARKKEAGRMEQFNYIISKLPAEDKKGF
jgi:aminopeptidase N